MHRFKKVLLIDEDPISTFLHTKLIRRTGFAEETVTVTSGKEACEVLARDCAGSGGSCPDLIFVDIHMRQMDGFEFVAEYGCLNLTHSSRIYLLTAAVHYKDLERAKKLGGVALLPKPLTAQALEAIRQEALGSLT